MISPFILPHSKRQYKLAKEKAKWANHNSARAVPRYRAISEALFWRNFIRCVERESIMLITQILESCDKIKSSRDYRDVLTSLVEEIGELSTEIAINSGHKKNREPSTDGIVGEALDVIIAAVDIINLAFKESGISNSHIEMLLMKKAQLKLEKWENGATIMNATDAIKCLDCNIG